MAYNLSWDSEIGKNPSRERERRQAVVLFGRHLQGAMGPLWWNKCPVIEAVERGADFDIAAEAVEMEVAQASISDGKTPKIVRAHEFISVPARRPPMIIEGLLHKGSKMIYGGPSKAMKSWQLMSLAVAIASGSKWLSYQCRKGRVLYINFELQPFAVHDRLTALQNAAGVESIEGLDIWNMRGHARRLAALVRDIEREESYDMIIPDPIYKAYAGIDENGTADVSEACKEIDALSERTGAAVVYGAHFAKGNASGKAAIDRVSGSGVWARDPDTIVTATPHEEDSAFTVDIVLRNFPPVDSFVVRWAFPLMARTTDLNPEDLREAANGKKAGSRYTMGDLLTCLHGSMTTKEWYKLCGEELGVSRAQFFRILSENPGYVRITENGRNKVYTKINDYDESEVLPNV